MKSNSKIFTGKTAINITLLKKMQLVGVSRFTASIIVIKRHKNGVFIIDTRLKMTAENDLKCSMDLL